MTRLCAFAIPVVVGIPLASTPNWHVGTLAGAAAVLLVTGVRRASVRVTTVGGMLAIVALALALSSQPPEFTLLRATAVGLALFYTVEDVNYVAHFASAQVDVAARRARYRARFQHGITAISTSTLVAVVAPGTAVALAMPEWLRVLLGAIGALVALLTAQAGAARWRLSAWRWHCPFGAVLRSWLKQASGTRSD